MRPFHHFVVKPPEQSAQKTKKKKKKKEKPRGQHLPFLCCVFPSASCLTSAERGAPEPRTTGLIKALLKYPRVSQDLQQLRSVLAVLFLSILAVCTYAPAIFIFSSRVQRKATYLGCVIVWYGHIQVMGNDDEQLNKTCLWEFSHHCGIIPLSLQCRTQFALF